MTCVHFLELAIAIQRERDTARRMQLLRNLPEAARGPVQAWLWADSRRMQSEVRRGLSGALDAETAEA